MILKKIFSVVCVLFIGFSVPIANAQCPTTAPQIIRDSGFEMHSPWPFWDIQFSLLYGTPLCDITCGGSAVPNTGQDWIWFGHSTGQMEVAAVGQTVNVPAPSLATLRFWLRVSEVAVPPRDDSLIIMANGAQVGIITEPAFAEFAYTERQVTFMLPAGSPTVVFIYNSPDNTPTSANTNFLVDDVTLNICAATAAGASISGRVMTSNGRAVSNASVTLTDASSGVTKTTRTSSFGYYRFEDVLAGQGYLLQPVSKRYVFTSRFITLVDELTGVDFVAEP